MNGLPLRRPKSCVMTSGPTCVAALFSGVIEIPTSRSVGFIMLTRWPAGLWIPPGPVPQSIAKPAWP
jgi:hypothetical protein